MISMHKPDGKGQAERSIFDVSLTCPTPLDQGEATTKPGLSHPPDFGVLQWGRGPRRRLADSVTDLPLGLVDIFMLIVARGCVEQFSRRFTHFAASAVPKAAV